MASVRKENVVIMATDNDTVDGPLEIMGIKGKAGGTGGSAQLKQTDTSGQILWQTATLAANAADYNQVYLRIGRGETLHLDTSDVTVFLYLK